MDVWGGLALSIAMFAWNGARRIGGWARICSICSVCLGIALAARADEALNRDTFEAVWRHVSESYYDASFGGLDWDAVGAEYRGRLSEVESKRELRELLTEMLYRLGESHVGILTADYEPESSAWLGGDAGVELCYAGDELVFREVIEGGAAWDAGIRAGDRLVSVDGRDLGAIREQVERSGLPRHLWRFEVLNRAGARFRGRPDAVVKAEVERPDGRRSDADVTLRSWEGRVTQRLGNMGELPFAFSFEEAREGIWVLRFSLWFPAAMMEIRQAMAALPEDARGLIVDLRGNPGGVGMMASGLAGLLVEEETKLGVTRMREGYINFVGFPQRGAYSGPVAILVDDGSASTSEVFAIGLQEAGRARVFGTQTAGAALPSLVFKLPNADFLQVAIGDFATPGGTVLEGRGVVPDEIVSISPVDLSEGRDSVVDAACDWLGTLDSN